MDSRALARRLEGDSYEPARRFREVLKQAPFVHRDYQTHTHHQAQVLTWCRWFAGREYGRLGLPQTKGGDPYGFHCLGYELGFFDLNLMMRFGLQFGFVLRAVSRLGSDQQEDWLSKLVSMELTACLAMTEVSHGSNVRALETRATFDPSSQEFVLETPNPGATKDFVSSVQSANIALVFARLVSGNNDHGVHAFLVPLGSEDSSIEISDCGPMGGLNGLNYGRLRFQGTKIPKENLLDRHGSVDENGNYHSSISSESHRFNAMIGTLVVGRSLVTGGAAAGAKTCLSIAITYADRRRQFCDSDNLLEKKILSYQAVQARLMPELATMLAIDAGRSRLAQCQHEYFEDSQNDRELETFTSALKSYTSSFAVRVAQKSRQTCGGAGCLAANRLTELRKDLDLFTTMEGDNTILDLMVARNLLTDFKRGLNRPKVVKALSWVTKNVNFAAQTNPLKSHDASSDQITSQVFLSRALKFRRDRLRFSLAGRVRSRLTKDISLVEALNDCQTHCLDLARAHCEEKIFRCLRNVLESSPPGWDRRIISQALTLFGLNCIDQNNGWFLEQAYLNPRQTRAVRNEILELCSVLASEASAIIEAFELPKSLLNSSLVEDAEVSPKC